MSSYPFRDQAFSTTDPNGVPWPPRHPQFRCDGGYRVPSATYMRWTFTPKEKQMTTRKERIEKAERAVIDAAKEWYLSDKNAGAFVASPVARLLEAEASGPPENLENLLQNHAAAKVLRVLVDQHGGTGSIDAATARDWADELEWR